MRVAAEPAHFYALHGVPPRNQGALHGFPSRYQRPVYNSWELRENSIPEGAPYETAPASPQYRIIPHETSAFYRTPPRSPTGSDNPSLDDQNMHLGPNPDIPDGMSTNDFPDWSWCVWIIANGTIYGGDFEEYHDHRGARITAHRQLWLAIPNRQDKSLIVCGGSIQNGEISYGSAFNHDPVRNHINEEYRRHRATRRPRDGDHELRTTFTPVGITSMVENVRIESQRMKKDQAERLSNDLEEALDSQDIRQCSEDERNLFDNLWLYGSRIWVPRE